MKGYLTKLCLLLLCSCSFVSASDSTKNGAAPFLFVLFAQKGEIESSTFTLQQVSQTVTYIGDLPKRKLGMIPTRQFFQFWDHKLYGKQAGLLFSQNGKQQEVSVHFSNPRYDEELDTLEVQISLINDQELPKGEVQGVIFFIEGFATMGVLP